MKIVKIKKRKQENVLSTLKIDIVGKSIKIKYNIEISFFDKFPNSIFLIQF